MICEQVQQVLEDFRCGELDPRDAARIESHLAACPECARRMESLRVEEKLYADYSTDLDRNLEVPAAMWDNVQAALEQPGQTGPSGGWLGPLAHYLPKSAVARQVAFAAALVVVSVGTTLLAVRYYDSLRESPGVFVRAGGAGNPQTLQGALQSIQRAEQEYLDAIRVLSEIVERRKGTLDPRLVAELEANLRAIDESIADTRRAYHEHPADAELAYYMLAAYSKKVELLQEIAT